jgi:thymidylate synthase ThyX
MNYTVTGLTIETEGLTKEQLESAKIFSGKNAGICYMGDSYFNSNVTDPDKALKRFISTANNNHHSIADHVRIEVLLEGVSKMLAIVLNSLQDYATSEKSGRYTIMTGNSEKETELYNKWMAIFEQEILKSYPDYNDKYLAKRFKKIFAEKEGEEIAPPSITNGKFELVTGEYADYYNEKLESFKQEETLPSKKLAQENARYVLSVFTYSTTFGYSTSLRQWNYIYDWCMKYCDQFESDTDDDIKDTKLVKSETGEEASFFETKLYYDLLNLANYIRDTMYVEELRDSKNRCFEFLTSYSGNPNHPLAKYDVSCFQPDYAGRYSYTQDTTSVDDCLGLVYNVAYPASFVHIAQAERHRTLKYYMVANLNDTSNLDFFIPPILLGTAYADEWLEDLHSVSDIIPQATKIAIIETGSIADFLLKCEERLCGRAQWEIMNQTYITASRFVEAAKYGEITNKPCLAYISKFANIDTNRVYTKCQITGHCTEVCYHLPSNALTRLV